MGPELKPTERTAAQVTQRALTHKLTWDYFPKTQMTRTLLIGETGQLKVDCLSAGLLRKLPSTQPHTKQTNYKDLITSRKEPITTQK